MNAIKMNAPLWEHIGSFSTDDGNGNKNVKISNRFIKKNNKFARASRFFVHFFALATRLRRKNA